MKAIDLQEKGSLLKEKEKTQSFPTHRKFVFPLVIILSVTILFSFYAKDQANPENVVTKQSFRQTTNDLLSNLTPEKETLIASFNPANGPASLHEGQETESDSKLSETDTAIQAGLQSDGKQADEPADLQEGGQESKSDPTLLGTDAVLLEGLQSDSSMTDSNENVKSGATMLVSSPLDNFRIARENLMQQLKVDYGEYSDKLFKRKTGGISRRLFVSPGSDPNGPSWDRMKRKLMMKLLKAQQVAKEGKEASPVKFVWATHGHSAAAGHGDMYRESYTAVMERSAKAVFESVGIEFIGRNYAMGSSRSAPEAALCLNEVFGKDADVFSWDHGMLEGRFAHHMQAYFFLAGRHQNRPACVGLTGSDIRKRVEPMKELENLGLTVFLLDTAANKEVEQQLPDNLGMSDEQIEALPPFVQSIRCGVRIEAGDPYCKQRKWNQTICTDRPFRTSWHPGWKWHALQGNQMALFMIDVLEDALQEISMRKMDPVELLSDLQKMEDAEYERFLEAGVTSTLDEFWGPQVRDEMGLDTFFKEPTICHIASLPAETRYKGILTESSQVGFDSYDRGIDRKQAAWLVSMNDTKVMGKFTLVHDRRRGEDCPETVDKDYKDYFYVSPLQGWAETRLPNDAEVREYGSGKPLLGYIGACMAKCDQKCPRDYEKAPADFKRKQIEMEVNGKPVVDYKVFGIDRCILLKSDKGARWEADSQGQFTIRARAKDGMYLGFSSFIIW